MAWPIRKAIPEGSHIHPISFASISNPLCEKKLPTPMGETLIGLHQKKYLSLLRGEKKATPNPPSVSASSNGCDSVDRNKKRKISQ
jgi:hypothetical protein